jgi:hypothetical protein
MAESHRNMGLAQVIAWLGAIVLAFLALATGLMALYRTEMLKRRMDEYENERADAEREVLEDVRDLLRRQAAGIPAETPIEPGEAQNVAGDR